MSKTGGLRGPNDVHENSVLAWHLLVGLKSARDSWRKAYKRDIEEANLKVEKAYAQGLEDGGEPTDAEHDLARVTAERDALREALEEREGDMHMRIRAGYDRTVADLWRAKVAEVEKERDAARAAILILEVDANLQEARAIITTLEKQPIHWRIEGEHESKRAR